MRRTLAILLSLLIAVPSVSSAYAGERRHGGNHGGYHNNGNGNGSSGNGSGWRSQIDNSHVPGQTTRRTTRRTTDTSTWDQQIIDSRVGNNGGYRSTTRRTNNSSWRNGLPSRNGGYSRHSYGNNGGLDALAAAIAGGVVGYAVGSLANEANHEPVLKSRTYVDLPEEPIRPAAKRHQRASLPEAIPVPTPRPQPSTDVVIVNPMLNPNCTWMKQAGTGNYVGDCPDGTRVVEADGALTDYKK